MCEPATLAIISAATAVIGSGVSAYGAIQSGKAQQSAMDYQAQTNRRNSIIAQQNATMERQAGIEEQRRQRINTAQIIGQQKAGMASNGIALDYGTALDTVANTAELGELDALMIGYNAEKRARNYLTQSSSFSSQSALNTMSGQNAMTSGMIGAGGSALGGIGKVADKWYNYKTTKTG